MASIHRRRYFEFLHRLSDEFLGIGFHPEIVHKNKIINFQWKRKKKQEETVAKIGFWILWLIKYKIKSIKSRKNCVKNRGGRTFFEWREWLTVVISNCQPWHKTIVNYECCYGIIIILIYNSSNLSVIVLQLSGNQNGNVNASFIILDKIFSISIKFYLLFGTQRANILWVIWQCDYAHAWIPYATNLKMDAH